VANVESDDEWFTDRLGDLVRDSILNYEVSEPNEVGRVDEVIKAGEPSTRSSSICAIWRREGAAAQQVLQRAFSGRANIYENTPGILDFTSIDASKAAMVSSWPPDTDPCRAGHGHRDHDSDAALLQWRASAWPWATPRQRPKRRPTSSRPPTCGTGSPRPSTNGLGRRGTAMSVPNPGMVGD